MDGYCVSIDVNEIAISTTDRKIVKIARSSLKRLELYRSPAHQVSALRKDVRRNLKDGVDFLFSPLAPAGLVLIPTALAWEAVAMPFCLLGDLKAKIAGRRDIHPI